jgi:hypothetical protein
MHRAYRADLGERHPPPLAPASGRLALLPILPPVPTPTSHPVFTRVPIPRNRAWRPALLFATVHVVLTGCDRGGIDPTDVAAYNRQDIEVSIAADTLIDAYYDYSLGMGEGMRAAARVNGALNDFLAGRPVRYFRVGDTPQPEPIADMTSSAANLMNLANFRDIGSRLQPVIQRVVSNRGRQSVFVTDFEATLEEKVLTPGAPKPHRIETKAWAQKDFRTWLQDGNRIDVFAFRFRKPDWWFARNAEKLLDNHVYTLVFTPKALLRGGTPSPASVLAFMLELHQRTNSPDYQHFAYWRDDVEVVGRDDPTTGNANPNSPVLDAGTDAGPPRMDYHAFALSEVRDWLEAEGSGQEADRRLLNGVQIRSRVAFVKDLVLGIDVTDVTGPVQDLADAASNRAPPDTVRNKETGTESLVDPVSRTPLAVVGTPVRRGATPGTAAPQTFVLVRNARTGDVGLKLDSAFAGVGAQTLYRLAITVKDAPLISDPAADRTLSLEYTGGFRVSALAESLRLAARDVAASLKGRTLYVSYVLLTP